jgi:chemotaxis protein MotB
MAGKGGGAWKVAYADFVTAMMAFFMVMWLTAQNSEVKEAVAEHFRNPPDDFNLLSFNRGVHEFGRDRERKAPRHPDEDKLPTARKPRVMVLREGNQPGAASSVTFAENSAELIDAGKEYLVDLVKQIKGKPQKVEVRGHTSRRPLPPESRYKSAWELSYARTQTVMQFLIEQGIDPQRIRLSQAGANEPVVANTGKSADLDRNERVEVYMLGEY